MFDFWLFDIILDIARVVHRILRFCHYRHLGPMIWGCLRGLF